MNDPELVEELFVAALEKGTPAMQAAYLAEACKDDDALRRRVERLLAAQRKVGGFLEAPAVALPFGPQPGELIASRYRLVEPIGEGGMGTVWVAEQIEPVRRRVAIKLIKPGMDSNMVLTRFESERQALALMDHPNIAKVLDGGLTAEGRPFFVMELVKGVPITEYCDSRKLAPKARLELFLPVCQALQHAHQKGILHRDVKPSNVLIALYDDKPVPKVIDFGLAKAVGQNPADELMITSFGGIVGTPAYMSPEQATQNNLDIDTRSDVYSLGALLYELLAGSPPFSEAELKKAGMMEMLRVVREVEPPRPSTKLSTAEGLAGLSDCRGTDATKLTQLLRRELDWIVIKALEKDRSRRYDSASGFAADIERYLAGEPVAAHPPSRVYRFRKFLRKHRGPVIAASLVIAALCAGIAGTTLGLFEARAQKRKTDEALQAEHKAKERAEELVRAFTVAHGELIYSVVGFDWLKNANPRAIKENLTNRLNDEVRWIDASGLTDPVALHQLRSQLCMAYRLIDLPQKALEQGRLSLIAAELIDANGPQVVISLFELSLSSKAVGDDAAAQSYRDRGVELARKLPPPADDAARQSWFHTARYLHEFGGEPDLAARFIEQTLADTRNLHGPRHRETLRLQHQLAWIRSRQGRYDEAIALEREALSVARTEFGDKDQHVWQMVHDAHQLMINVGRVDPILLAAVREIVGMDRIGDSLMVVAAAEMIRNGQFAEAEVLLRPCVESRTKNKPDAWTTFNAISLLGEALSNQKKYAEAEPLLLKGYEGLAAREATIPASSKVRLTEAIDRLIAHFTAAQKPDEVQKWQAERVRKP